MTWFVSTGDIIMASIFGFAGLIFLIGWTASFLIEKSGSKSNCVHGFIFLAVIAAYLSAAGSAAYWVLA